MYIQKHCVYMGFFKDSHERNVAFLFLYGNQEDEIKEEEIQIAKKQESDHINSDLLLSQLQTK